MSQSEKHAGIWIRVSTEEQAQGESPENHLARARMYCELHDWQAVEIYDLSGVSGKSVINHPEAQRMLADVASGHITGLIFSRLARLARNTRELLEIADHFKQHDAALISISENLDTSTPAGQLMYTLFGALAEWERSEISARVAASVPIRAAQGKPTGGIGPWGYKWADTPAGRRLVVDEEAAQKVREIFSVLLEESGNILRTANRLNAMGMRTRRGAKFTLGGLRRIIDDSVYSGRRRANYSRSTGDGKHWVQKPEKEWVYYDVEPVLAPGVWERSRELRAIRRVATGNRGGIVPPKESKYIFGGLLQCSCGTKLYMYHTLKDGDLVYRCRKCQRKVKESVLLAQMQEVLEKIIVSPGDLQPTTEAKPGESADDIRARGLALVREAEALKQRKVALLEMCPLDPALRNEIMEQLKGLVERTESIQAEALRLGALADQMELTAKGYGPLLKKASSLKKLWPHLEYEEKRLVVKELIESVTLSDEGTKFTAYWLPSLCKGSHTVRDSWLPPG